MACCSIYGCGLCGPEGAAEWRRAQEIHSKTIDDELLRDYDDYRKTHRILLQGSNSIHGFPYIAVN